MWLLIKTLLIDFLPKIVIPPYAPDEPPIFDLATLMRGTREKSPESKSQRSMSSDALKTPKPPSKGLAEPSKDQSPSNNSPATGPRLPSAISRRTVSSPLTPASARPRSGRHFSSNSISSMGRQRSSDRRMSLPSHSRSPSTASHFSSLRLVGEALDDSDSSSSPELTGPGQQDRVNPEWTNPLSPGLLPIQEFTSAADLSQDDNAEWPGVDEGEESPIPDSSESEPESDDSDASHRAARSSSLKRKPRRRSSTINSTLASLNATSDTVESLEKQVPQTSGSTTPDTPQQQPENPAPELNNSTGTDTHYLLEQSNSGLSSIQSAQGEAQPIPSGVPRIAISEPATRRLQDALETDEKYFLERSQKWRDENEEVYRDAAWDSIRDSFEYFLEIVSDTIL